MNTQLLSIVLCSVLWLSNSGIVALADFLRAQHPATDGEDAQTAQLQLVSFADPTSVDTWYSRTDTVMGGISDSTLQPTLNGTAVFNGVVRFENSGGFATVQTDFRASRNLAAYDGLTLRFRGDGKTYGITVRNNERAIGFEASFATTANTWQNVRIPWSAFIPKRSGRIVQGYVLDPANIRSMRLIISEQAGPYSLEVAHIGAYDGMQLREP